jgi:hypothetical protein
MAHVIPTLRTMSHSMYTPPAIRRRPDTAPSTGRPAPPPDFNTELQNQTDPPPASRMIGSVNLGTPVAPTPAATTYPMAPTAQALFGANPWSTDAGGTGPGGSYNYNHYYFATPQTAAKVAQMLGGTVVAMNAITPYGPFVQNQPNQMVQMPDGKLINAGLVAGMYDHGYTQQAVDSMIAGEISGNVVI